MMEAFDAPGAAPAILGPPIQQSVTVLLRKDFQCTEYSSYTPLINGRPAEAP